MRLVSLLRCLPAFFLVLSAVVAEDLSEADAERILAGLQAETRRERLQAVERCAGKSGPRTVATLCRCLSQEEWIVRAKAIEYLETQEREAAEHVLEQMVGDEDPRVRGAVLICLAGIQGRDALGTLERVRGDREEAVRISVARALGRIEFAGDDERDGRRHLGILGDLVTDQEVTVRLAALSALAALTDSAKATNALLHICGDESEEVVLQAGAALAERQVQAGKALGRLATDREEKRRVAACLAMGEIGDPSVDAPLLKALSDPEWEVVAAAAEAMGVIAPAEERGAAFVEGLLARLGHPDPKVRACVAWSLLRLGSRKGLEGAIRLLGHPDHEPVIAVLCQVFNRPHLDNPAAWQNWWKQDGQRVAIPQVPMAYESEIEYYSITDSFASVVFVVDRSGSMEAHRKIQRARQELRDAVYRLEFNTRFNVVSFSDGVYTWQRGPLRGSWRNKLKLSDYMGYLQPSGRTNIYGALCRALRQWGAEVVYFMTDGMPTRGVTGTGAIVTGITRRNHDLRLPMRIHTVAFMVPEAAAFLRKLASANGGQYKLVK